MSINNRFDFVAEAMAAEPVTIADHILRGRNVQVAPGTYTPDFDTGLLDSVTFAGTSRSDHLLGGGGEIYTFFVGTAGRDLYGTQTFTTSYVDYSAAPTGVVVDMSFRGTSSFTDASGETRTVGLVGRAWDGFGGIDHFMESTEEGLEGFSTIFGIFGSSHRDVMIGDGGFADFFGGRGNDLLIGGFSRGGDGNDVIIGRATGDFQSAGIGENGNDVILGTDFIDFNLIGGAGNDWIFAGGGDDGSGRGRFVSVTGNEGNDTVNGGAGDDFIDGGIGADVLVSGAGTDIINPDVEFFQTNSAQATDGARDLILVRQSDLGATTDTILFNAFEEGIDQIRFRDAVRGGTDFRVTHQDNATTPGAVNTILQIDRDGDGFGAGTADADDYFLVALGADLSLQPGHILS